MRDYELMFIIKPALGEEKTEAVIEKIKGLIEKHQGEVEKINKWGSQKLAYEIKDFREGFYVVINYKAEADLAEELDRVIKITDEVLKHMIIRLED